MRRTALALFITLLSLPTALAQQSQTPPPPPPAPRAVPPAPPTPPPPPEPAMAGVASGVRGGVAIGRNAPRAVGAATLAPAAVAMSVTPTSWQNIKLDITISDSLSADLQNKKSVSMLILDGRAGQVRSSAGEGLINIDARPSIRPDGRIYLQLTIEYRPELSNQEMQQAGLNRTALFSESLALVVVDGKPVVASQSADPKSDRRVAVEVTAGVVK